MFLDFCNDECTGGSDEKAWQLSVAGVWPKTRSIYTKHWTCKNACKLIIAQWIFKIQILLQAGMKNHHRTPFICCYTGVKNEKIDVSRNILIHFQGRLPSLYWMFSEDNCWSGDSSNHVLCQKSTSSPPAFKCEGQPFTPS